MDKTKTDKISIKEFKREQTEKAKAEKRKSLKDREYYSLRSILGYFNWAIFYFLLGGREAGKSYAVTNFYVKQFVEEGIPFYWLRLSESSARKLLSNNAEKLIDPDIRRKYNLNLITNGNTVYNRVEVSRRTITKGKRAGEVEIKYKNIPMAYVYSLATFYNDKGSGLYDKDFLKNPNMKYNICLDEMNREKGERKSFDIVYNFANQLENLIRSTKEKIRVICIGNTLEEASDLLASLNFIPEEFGRYKLKSKRAVIDYIEPSEAYLKRRKGTVADILSGNSSTFTNMIETDKTLIYKGRLEKPVFVIKFSKDKSDWFTLWDNNCITKYNGENKPVIAMKPYLDEKFITQVRDNVIVNFDMRNYLYRNLITFKLFQKHINLLKPRGN